MTSPVSSSEGASGAFSLLHPDVQRWVYERGWNELHEIQEQAIEPILAGRSDIILAAPTAGGKTEAAFLPICSRLIQEPPGRSIAVLAVSPLKALINDQYERLEELCERVKLTVNRWHGDVAQGSKQRLLKNPQGILLITPESLEALFVLRGPALATLLGKLVYVVVDELHAFIGSERGRQVQSLLHRVELTVRRRIPRIALSATLGDMQLAADFLRPRSGQEVLVLVSREGSQELKMQVRGYITSTVKPKDLAKAQDETISTDRHIAQHLLSVLRGSNNLIFCNRRQAVEVYADLLRELCQDINVPNEFLPHHGNLSKELREETEHRLKKASLPVNAVCTTTLELGIDIGSVRSIAQIGPPHSVASLRQRLGRSGRTGEAAILRIYIQEPVITPQTPPQDALRLRLVQAIAMIQLLLEKWYEPPADEALHLSTLIQQVMSVLTQIGGAKAQDLYIALCDSGPFRSVTQELFVALLRAMGQHELVQQCRDGTLIVGKQGEALVSHYDFYTAFKTPEEYQLATAERTLGTLPIESPLLPGMYIIFAGRRWEVVSVETHRRLILVKAAPGGRPPIFGGTTGFIHHRVRQVMRQVYLATDVPPYLDTPARDLLGEGREYFHRYGLAEQSILSYGSDTILFTWAGDRITSTLAVQLSTRGLHVEVAHGSITVRAPKDKLATHLQELVAAGPADPLDLAKKVSAKAMEKYDDLLSEELLCAEYAARALDVQGSWEALQELLK